MQRKTVPQTWDKDEAVRAALFQQTLCTNLWRVDAPWGVCFGVVANGLVVTEVAPVAWWALGKPLDEVLVYFLERGAAVEHVTMAGITIVSGGQTGADRGALDAAIEMEVPHRGWCPRGRRAEDGIIPAHYNLRETARSGYELRTELNVADSQATLCLTHGPLTGGSKLTYNFVVKQKKLWAHLDLAMGVDVVPFIVDFIRAHNIRELNVAGNRESKAPGIQEEVKNILMRVLVRL